MLYPPILASTQSVFSINEIPNGYEVKFSLAAITTYDEIGHIGILVAKQSNNRSIANTSLYPDGIIYKSWDQKENSIIIASNGNPNDIDHVAQGDRRRAFGPLARVRRSLRAGHAQVP